MLARALTLRCPKCGTKWPFVHCAEEGEGHYLGSMVWNLIICGGIALAVITPSLRLLSRTAALSKAFRRRHVPARAETPDPPPVAARPGRGVARSPHTPRHSPLWNPGCSSDARTAGGDRVQPGDRWWRRRSRVGRHDGVSAASHPMSLRRHSR